MGVVSNLQAGNFATDGAYVQVLPAQPQVPTGPQTNQIALVGGASWGPVNTPVAFSDTTSAFAAFGTKTTTIKNIVRSAINAMPECSNFLGVRVTDSTDTKATMSIMDTAGTPAPLVTLTAVFTGSYANGASVRCDLQNGSSTSPVYQITVFFPNAPAQVFSNIVGYATIGSGFSAATFKANAVSAINGQVANVPASPYFVAAAGASIFTAVNAGTVFTATSGTDGDAGVTDTICLGADGSPGTGAYSLRGQVAGGQIVIVGLTTTSVFPTLAALCQQEGALGHFTFAQGTSTSTAAASKATNSLSHDFMLLDIDWDYVFDQYAAANGTSNGLLLTPPAAATAAVIAQVPPYLYPGNKPYAGKQNIVGTERLSIVNNGNISASTAIGQAEKAQRQAAGLLYLGPTPRGPLGLPFGTTSSGRLISDVRMQIQIGYALQGILGNFVGEMLSTDPNDETLRNARAAVDTFMQSLLAPTRKISAYKNVMDSSDNTSTTIGQGFLICKLSVQTLSAAQFAVAALQVGNTVQIVTTPVGG